MQRHFYGRARDSSSHARENFPGRGGAQRSPRGGRGYMNVYQNRGAQFQTQPANPRQPRGNFYRGGSQPGSQCSIARTPRQRSTQRSSAREQLGQFGSQQRMRSDPQLNSAQPKNMLDTLMRKMPIQRSQSHSRKAIVGVAVSQRTSLETSVVHDSESRLGSNAFLNIPKVQTNYGSANQISQRGDSEDRLGASPFISIPKVQANYASLVSPRKKRRRRVPKTQKKQTLRDKLRQFQQNRAVRQGVFAGQQVNSTKRSIVSREGAPGLMRSLRHAPGAKGKAPGHLGGYSEIKRQVDVKKLFQKTHDLSEDLRLHQNIFEQQKGKRESEAALSTSLDAKAFQSLSRLENFLQTKEKKAAPKKVEQNAPKSFGMLREMWARQESSFETGQTEASGESAGPRAAKWRGQKRDPRIAGQLRSISAKEMDREFNAFVRRPSKAELARRVLGLNRELTSLRREYLQLRRCGREALAREAAAKKRKLTGKQRAMYVLVENLRRSGKLAGLSLAEQSRIADFERGLSPAQLELRREKLAALRKIDARCAQLEKAMQSGTYGAEARVAALEQRNRALVQREVGELVEALKESPSADVLVQKMRKMIQTVEDSEG